jgi:hypothetical protein
MMAKPWTRDVPQATSAMVSRALISASMRRGVYRQASPASIKSRDISAMGRASEARAGLSVTVSGRFTALAV